MTDTRLASRPMIFDGAKSMRLEDLPESAWTIINGSATVDQTTPQGIYQIVPWVFRACQIRATALAALPWSVRAAGADDAENLLESDHWKAVRGLEWTRHLRGLLLRTELADLVYGRAYWLRTGNLAQSRVLDMRWLLPTTVLPQFSGDAGLVGFKRIIGGQEFNLPVEDLVYFWQPSVTAELGPGPSPVQVALRAAGIIANVDTFASAFFERGAINATILSVPTSTPDSEIRRLENWWKRMVRGVKRAFETVGLRAEVTPTVLSSPPKDLAMTELSQEKKRDIAVALGVPFTLLFSEASNKATAQQDDINLYTKTVIPESGLIEETLNSQVFEPLGYSFRFEPSKLEVFEEREAEKAFALIAALQAGAISVNEWRDKMDLEPKPGGDDLREPTAVPKFGSDQESRGQTASDNGASQGQAQNRRAVDLERWQRKALKALKAGKNPSVPFESEAIQEVDYLAIRSALAIANTADEVRAAFSVPFRLDDESYP